MARSAETNSARAVLQADPRTDNPLLAARRSKSASDHTQHSLEWISPLTAAAVEARHQTAAGMRQKEDRPRPEGNLRVSAVDTVVAWRSVYGPIAGAAWLRPSCCPPRLGNPPARRWFESRTPAQGEHGPCRHRGSELVRSSVRPGARPRKRLANLRLTSSRQPVGPVLL